MVLRLQEIRKSESTTPVALVVLDQVLVHHVLCLWYEKQGSETGISFAEIIKKTDKGISGCTGGNVPVR